MNIKELIVLSDLYAPKAYADFKETEWGVMFYDEKNKTMHDVNHACIIKDESFVPALQEIRAFYTEKGITPRIYLSGFQHRDHKSDLASCGFGVYRFGNFQHFLLLDSCTLAPADQLQIRELKSKNDITEKLLNNLYHTYLAEDSDTINRSRALLRRVVQSKDCRLFCGFFENEPACIAMLVKTPFGMYCFDLVETAEKFKGRGFASELIAYLVRLCDRPAFLFSENPAAIRIYEKAGFRRIKVSPEPCFYRAVYQER